MKPEITPEGNKWPFDNIAEAQDVCDELWDDNQRMRNALEDASRKLQQFITEALIS